MSKSDKIFDICIVGAGAAGIVLTLELAEILPNASILLLEYGSADRFTYGNNPLDDSIVIRNLVNHHSSAECTNKGLGGTTNTWGGRCVMYDSVDFVPRPILAGQCTWDEAFYEDCLPFVSRTQKYFDCSGDFAYPATQPPIAEYFESSTVTDLPLELWSLPTRFAKSYKDSLRNNSNITIRYETEVRSVKEEGGVVVLDCCDSARRGCYQFSARKVVLASGAFEVTRILLRSVDLFAKIGHAPNALGRYYQGHLSGKIASVKFSGRPELTDFGFGRRQDGAYVRRRFQFTEKALVQHNLLNTAMWLDNPLYFNPKHASGAMSFMYLAMLMPWLGAKLAPPAIRHSITKGKAYKIGSHIRNILKGLPSSLLIPFMTFCRRYVPKRKLPGVFLYSPCNEYALHFHAEQIPLVSNRLTLHADGETLEVAYELCDDDVSSVIECHKLLDQELRRCGAGSLVYWFPFDELPLRIREMSRDGVHQCGTTRISRTVDTGVVDYNLCVHGTKQVYVCSSSCFPTSGQANPTFFVGVVAVRLAHHLARINHAKN